MVDVVVKVGGALLAHGRHFDAVLATIGDVARDRRLLVVPGGGPFADAVRSVDRRIALSDDAAHWMAVLAIDQYAHLLADRLGNAIVVADRPSIGAALDGKSLPVLAPFRWLRDRDPLPHSWNVTSDSIAAWVAGEVGAPRLVLVKPPGALRAATDLVDAGFSNTLPLGLEVLILGAEQREELRRALDASR
jgi:aspartokinase-like uncharacterized kinase